MQYYSVSSTSVIKVPSSIVESYILLAGNEGGDTSSATNTAAGQSFVAFGTTTASGVASTAAGTNLFTFNSSWPNSTNVAFEVAIANSSTTGTVSAALWDITSGAIVSSSQISHTAGDAHAYILRSGQFTLTPGHSYGITFWTTLNTVEFIHGALIVFG